MNQAAAPSRTSTMMSAAEEVYARYPMHITLASGQMVPTKSVMSVFHEDKRDFVRTTVLNGAHPVFPEVAAQIRRMYGEIAAVYDADADAERADIEVQAARLRELTQQATATRKAADRLTMDEADLISDEIATVMYDRGVTSAKQFDALDLCDELRAAMELDDWTNVAAIAILLKRKTA